MLVILALFAALFGAPIGVVNTRSIPADVSDVKSRLVVFTDQKGHYMVLVPFGQCDKSPLSDKFDESWFYGDGKTFFRQVTIGGGADCQGSQKGGGQFDRVMWDPRLASRPQFEYRDEKYTMTCGERVTELKPLAKAEMQAMLDGGKFFESRWDRLPYALARDDQGAYYFVDIDRDVEDKTGQKVDFRLYIGPRGSLK